MLNEDSVQTHNNNSSNNNGNSQESSPPTTNPVLMQQQEQQEQPLSQPQPHNNTSTTSNIDTFNYPNSPKPTRIIMSKQPPSYHATITASHNHHRHHHHKRRSTIKRMTSFTSTITANNTIVPPQNKLAFINAVKIAWSLQIKRGKSRKLQQNNKKSAVAAMDSNHSNSSRVKIVNSNRVKIVNSSSHNNIIATGSNSDISMKKNKLDFPPITAEALSELSVSQLFKSLQIRHDLLVDPNLTFRPNLTAEKSQESDIYWNRLDHLIKSSASSTPDDDNHYQLIFLVRNLLTELSLILISLISPFPSHPTTSYIWNWPQQITENYILSVLDPDLIHQQLIQGCLNVDFKFSFLDSVLQPLCPDQAIKIQKLVDDNEYARALELCFLTLETIKLDCANKALHYYRPYLIETGTSLEWKIFLNQLDNGEVNTSSVSEWMKCTFDRLGHGAKFINVFRTGLVNLVTDDNDTVAALKLQASTTFPITFCYDEKRLKHQMRHEFQNIIVIGLLLMPYRLMAGKKAKQSDLNQLKSTFSKLLKDASVASGRVSCFHVALHACNMAKQVVLSKEDVIEQARYWSNWMNQNLRNTSPVYKIMYDRVRSILLNTMAQQGGLGINMDYYTNEDYASTYYTHATVGLEKDITKLGKKLTLIADYNLRTFGSLYTYLLPSVRNSLSLGL